MRAVVGAAGTDLRRGTRAGAACNLQSFTHPPLLPQESSEVVEPVNEISRAK